MRNLILVLGVGVFVLSAPADTTVNWTPALTTWTRAIGVIGIAGALYGGFWLVRNFSGGARDPESDQR